MTIEINKFSHELSYTKQEDQSRSMVKQGDTMFPILLFLISPAYQPNEE